MFTTIAKFWIPAFKLSTHQRVTLQQRQRSREAYLGQTEAWRSFVRTSQTQLHELFQASIPADECVIDRMHQV